MGGRGASAGKSKSIVQELKKTGLYDKLANRYKKNAFFEGRSVEQLARNNPYLNKPIDEIRKEYQEISQKLSYEDNYTDPENRNYKQIQKDRLTRDKISFALDYRIYKEKK